MFSDKPTAPALTMHQRRLNAIIDGAELPLVVQRLGLGGLDSWEPGIARKTMQIEDHHCTGSDTPYQALFGGTIAALADQICAFAAMTVVPDGKIFRTIDLQTNFYAPMGSGMLTIIAHIRHRSGHILHIGADMTEPTGKLIAQSKAIQIITSV